MTAEFPLPPYLKKNAHRFDFLQLTRLLERAYPKRRAVGEGVEPEKETVRFRSRAGFDFPAGSIDRLESGNGEKHEPPVMWVNFMGLAGQFGPMPQVLTELILEREGQKDFAIRDFLDIFNHRLLSLMVRIQKKNRPGLEVKKPDDASFSQFILSLIGMGTEGMRNDERPDLEPRALISMAGLLLRPTRTIQGLTKMLGHYFAIPISAKQFIGKWVDLDSDQWSRLSSRPGGATLGKFPVLGQRVWDQQGGIELVLGPLDNSQFYTFLPNGSAYRQLRSMIRFYVGANLEVDIQLVKKPEPLAGVRLSSEGTGGQLGWTSWLASSQQHENLSVNINGESHRVTGNASPSVSQNPNKDRVTQASPTP